MSPKKRVYFPSRIELEEAVVAALEALGGEATVPQINQKVIEILQLPPEIVELEDENDMGTKLNYRLRWCRTNLKGIKIENPTRGIWRLKK